MSLLLKEKYYIGKDKAIVEVHRFEPDDFPGKLYPTWELEISDGDHMRIDEQGYDKLHEGEY